MIYLQRYPSGRIGKEEQSILLHATMERMPVSYFTYEQLTESDSPLITPGDLLVGSVASHEATLSSLGLQLPAPDYYPQPLRSYLGRQVWVGKKESVLSLMAQDFPVFAKPLDKWKTFTGQVFSQQEGFGLLNSLDPGFDLWLSDVVEIENEFRVYVKNHQILACCQYTGEEDDAPDMHIIENAVRALQEHGGYSSTYAFDWANKKDGTTIFVEMNGAFAIGKYIGISDKQYFEFLEAGFKELTGVTSNNSC